jgi:hypothetical protein
MVEKSTIAESHCNHVVARLEVSHARPLGAALAFEAIDPVRLGFTFEKPVLHAHFLS